MCFGRGVLSCGFFFFSSRRRHTRLVSDWSSDVCSSDLFSRFANRDKAVKSANAAPARGETLPLPPAFESAAAPPAAPNAVPILVALLLRSEERRVGKECRSRRSPCD